MLPFPLWIVHFTDQIACSADLACNNAGNIVVFSGAGRAADFVTNHGDSDNLHLRLITKRRAVLLLADLHRWGVVGVCLDPDQDGYGGQFYSLREFMDRVQSVVGE